MSVTPVALKSNTMSGAMDVGLNSIYNFALEPQVMGELIKLYGRGVGLKDIITFGGNVINVASSQFEVQSQGSILNYIVNSTQVAAAASAGAAITVRVANINYNEQLLAKNDVILIPAEYVNSGAGSTPCKVQVTAATAGAGYVDYTCRPLLSTDHINVAIPANTPLMVTLGNYAPGTDGGNERRMGWYRDTFYTAIKKAAFALGGSTQSDKRYQDTMKNGYPGMFTIASIIADFTLDAAISDELLVGVVPNNVTQSDFNNVSRTVRGTKGLWPHLESGGMSQLYVEDYAISDFDDVADGFESQGVLSKFATFAMGSDLYRSVENSGLEFIREFSGGTDLMKNMGELGINFRRILKNGIDFTLVKLDTFSNPFTYGLSSYNWKKFGFIVPSEYAMVRNVNGGDTLELANLTLGYKNYNGEDRTRVFGVINGMTGRHPNGSFVSEWDVDKGEFLSEFMLIATKVNQMIRVQPA